MPRWWPRAALATALLGAAAVPPATAAVKTATLPQELLPYGLATAPDGRIWVVAHDRRGNANGADYRYRGVVADLGPGDDFRIVVDVTDGDVGLPSYPIFGRDGALYGAGGSSGRVIRVTRTGEIRNFAAAPRGKSVGDVALGRDGAIWFRSTPGEGRFLGRIDPSGAVLRFTSGLASSPRDLSPGPTDALWLTESAGRLLHATREGRITPVPTPRGARFDALAPAGGDAVWAVNDGDRLPGVWRVTRSGAAYSTCRFRPLPFGSELVPGADGSVWTMVKAERPARSPTFPVHISRRGVVTAYRKGLSDVLSFADLAAGRSGSLLIGYDTGPPDPLKRVGHVARVTPGSGGEVLCRSALRRVRD